MSRKDLVVAALRAGGSFRSAQQIYAELRGAGQSIGLATVYRTLSGLATVGELDTITTPDGETLYRACTSTDHHHHLTCRQCGRAVELDAEVVEAWASAAAQAHRFTHVAHVVEIVGMCQDCSAAS